MGADPSTDRGPEADRCEGRPGKVLISAEELHNRIREAGRYLPLDRLALSPQCGFASVAKGNSIPPELQEWKLKLVADVAREVWPEDAPLVASA